MLCPRETGDIFVGECPGSKRTKEVLETMILKHVHTGTTILTDGWAAYRDLARLGDPYLSHLTTPTRLHPQVGEPWAPLCRSGHWRPHQPDWIHVRPYTWKSNAIPCPVMPCHAQCPYRWFAIKRTLPRGGSYSLDRCGVTMAFSNIYPATWSYSFGGTWSANRTWSHSQRCSRLCPCNRDRRTMSMTLAGWVSCY